VGEAAALHAAEILTLDEAVTVIYHRSRLQHALAGSGGMLAAGISVTEANELLRGSEAAVSIAAINSPTSLTLSGDIAVLQRFHAQLEAQGRFARMLQVEVPYHSPRMNSLEHELVRSLSALRPRAGHRPYYSTIDLHGGDSAIGDADYWWRNVRQTVLFAAAMDKAIDDGHVCFLEVSPHPVLRTSIQECLSKRGVQGTVVSSLRRGQSDFDMMAASLGELHVAGATIAWDRIIGPGRVVQLPTYPWQRSRHWAESNHAEQYRKGSSVVSGLRATAHRHALLGGRLDLPTPTWLHTIRLAESAYLSDHRSQGAVVFPGTGYLEMAMQTLADEDATHGAEPHGGEYLLLSDVEIGRALYLADSDNARLQTTRNGDRWAIHSSTEDGSWLHHASGKCRREAFHHAPVDLALDSIKARCSNSLPADYAYRLFCDVGLQYGPTFQAIDELWYGADESLARLEIPPPLAGAEAGAPSGFLFHPALLDACLHTLFGALNLNGQDADRRGNAFRLSASGSFACIAARPTAVEPCPAAQPRASASKRTCASTTSITRSSPRSSTCGARPSSTPPRSRRSGSANGCSNTSGRRRPLQILGHSPVDGWYWLPMRVMIWSPCLRIAAPIAWSPRRAPTSGRWSARPPGICAASSTRGAWRHARRTSRARAGATRRWERSA
jgi:hybrid polyketide synthase/nonribosomal peptide synthetase FtdB